jgi:hypothetical protein
MSEEAQAINKIESLLLLMHVQAVRAACLLTYKSFTSFTSSVALLIDDNDFLWLFRTFEQRA